MRRKRGVAWGGGVRTIGSGSHCEISCPAPPPRNLRSAGENVDQLAFQPRHDHSRSHLFRPGKTEAMSAYACGARLSIAWMPVSCLHLAGVPYVAYLRLRHRLPMWFLNCSIASCRTFRGRVVCAAISSSIACVPCCSSSAFNRSLPAVMVATSCDVLA